LFILSQNDHSHLPDAQKDNQFIASVVAKNRRQENDESATILLSIEKAYHLSYAFTYFPSLPYEE
jgi:hypothetical protein